MAIVDIVPAETANDIKVARQLFVEYQKCLEFDLRFQNFEQELAHLPGEYAPPTGCILFAKHKGDIQGCVALRNLGGVTCEMKRLYVRSDYRGLGIGRRLAEAVINVAKELDYRFMRLDFISPRPAAWALYESLAFREIEPYESIPVEGAVFMELKLQ
ncbi:MAG: GNAT family N-acetyltransferase [Phycisphaerales bacterium]|nr:MAG: GNAT family N-acetyltransferase [Phycisphaerales bacterium]